MLGKNKMTYDDVIQTLQFISGFYLVIANIAFCVSALLWLAPQHRGFFGPLIRWPNHDTALIGFLLLIVNVLCLVGHVMFYGDMMSISPSLNFESILIENIRGPIYVSLILVIAWLVYVCTVSQLGAASPALTKLSDSALLQLRVLLSLILTVPVVTMLSTLTLSLFVDVFGTRDNHTIADDVLTYVVSILFFPLAFLACFKGIFYFLRILGMDASHRYYFKISHRHDTGASDALLPLWECLGREYGWPSSFFPSSGATKYGYHHKNPVIMLDDTMPRSYGFHEVPFKEVLCLGRVIAFDMPKFAAHRSYPDKDERWNLPSKMPSKHHNDLFVLVHVDYEAISFVSLKQVFLKGGLQTRQEFVVYSARSADVLSSGAISLAEKPPVEHWLIRLWGGAPNSFLRKFGQPNFNLTHYF